MALSLPSAASLADAVREVIKNSLTQDYRPIWFFTATQDGYAPNLVGVCTRLIMNPENLADLEKAVAKHPKLLTLEDFALRYGSAWGFAKDVVEMAHARSLRFNQVAGRQRWK